MYFTGVCVCFYVFERVSQRKWYKYSDVRSENVTKLKSN